MALSVDFKGLDSDHDDSRDHHNILEGSTHEGEEELNMSHEERQMLLHGIDHSSNSSSSNAIYSSYSSSSSRLMPKHFSPARYWKNLIVLSLACMFMFSAYSALANLQSSLHYSEGLGVASLCAIYIGVIISSLFAPLVIWVLKVKWTLVVCSVFYAVFSASNIYPAVYTLIPAAALLGLAASPFWTAIGTYLTTSAIQLADVQDGIPEPIINRFNGIFFCFFQSAQVWGNLISSLVLQNTSSSDTMSQCGRYSCGTGITFNITDSVEMAGEETLILVIIYIILGLVATFIYIFLVDSIPKVNYRGTKTWKTHLSDHLVSTFHLMKTPYLFLLIPLMIYNGAEQAFISADFTKSFVSCTKGAGEVGYVMIGFGVADALSSAIFGQLEKYSGRIVIFLFGGVVHLALLTGFELWNPEHSATWQLVLFAVGWGIGDAVWQTQISSLVGVIFPESQEPAFANFRLWQAVGFAVTYALTIPSAICISHKIYGLMAFLTFSIICYIIEEYLISRPAPPWTD
ncbi:protein unc-93 homolog A-like [Lytechinus variegatus]|uniref:protein unc-93 homolog A-like n=1 Tax=Lytechinus variegatus TaxID=7654 RepID=UPI001BB1172A|nr:protein unc-93 homolog A-like [Lytechinus variegatus]